MTTDLKQIQREVQALYALHDRVQQLPDGVDRTAYAIAEMQRLGIQPLQVKA